ncbi:MAG: zf-HC2 domain-containing protein [Armatimonadetes bacterium]|nr:zf-HC2 domain-containing protein [Armatimonadota bacterium]
MDKILSCQETIVLLQGFVDRDLTPEESEQVHAHLDHCPPCREAFVFEGKILRRIKDAMMAESIPDDLMQKIIGMIHNS